MNIIGIDIGTTLVKIIETNENLEILNKMTIDKTYTKNCLDIFIEKFNIDIKNIGKLVLTGIGANKTNLDTKSIPKIMVDEIEAIAIGGTMLSGKENALIVSVGTGTAFVKVRKKEYIHLGGTGIGGGSFIKLCNAIIHIDDMSKIQTLLNKGTLENVNLNIGDITEKETKTLLKDITAVNLGKLSNETKKEDIALGLLNMIVETIGMMAVFSVQNKECKDVVITGSFTKFPKAEEYFKRIETIQDINFIIPKNAEFATILGAVKKVFDK